MPSIASTAWTPLRHETAQEVAKSAANESVNPGCSHSNLNVSETF